MGDGAWHAQRSEAAAGQLRRLQERQAAETERARAMIAQFLLDVRAAGVEPVALRARGYDGTGRYRTGLHGWYLRANESVAVGTDGQFYVLSVPGGPLALVRGATPPPSDPPLVLGKGARDGESIDLDDALARVLGTGS